MIYVNQINMEAEHDQIEPDRRRKKTHDAKSSEKNRNFTQKINTYKLWHIVSLEWKFRFVPLMAYALDICLVISQESTNLLNR